MDKSDEKSEEVSIYFQDLKKNNPKLLMAQDTTLLKGSRRWWGSQEKAVEFCYKSSLADLQNLRDFNRMFLLSECAGKRGSLNSSCIFTFASCWTLTCGKEHILNEVTTL